MLTDSLIVISYNDIFVICKNLIRSFWKILVQDGDYYRLLTDGDYHVTASMDGYLSSTKLVTVENKHHNEAKIMNFTLQPVSFKKCLFIFNTYFLNTLNVILIFTPVSCFNWISVLIMIFVFR